MDEKLKLSPIRREDEERFYTLSQKEEILRFLPDWQMTPGYSSRLAEASRNGEYLSPAEQQLLWGIYVGATLEGAFSMGPEWRIGYRMAVGFWLNPEVWGRGYAKTALYEGEKAALSAGIEMLYAITACENRTAYHTLLSAGYAAEEEILLRPEGRREKERYFVLKKNLKTNRQETL